MELKPIKLIGNWDEGYALALHTLSSTYLGEDEYGKPQFDSQYTVLGDLIKRFKYRKEHEVLREIMCIVRPFLQEWQLQEKFDMVLPVPPSKLDRQYQPVFDLAAAIASDLGICFNKDVLTKNTREQVKSAGIEERDLTGCITLNCHALRSCSLLIVDDLYQTGSTLRECTRMLREVPNVKKISVLTMTKTRRS